MATADESQEAQALSTGSTEIALTDLGPLQHRALARYFIEYREIDEIAAETGCPVPVIHEALIDGINALRGEISSRPIPFGQGVSTAAD